MFVDLWKQNTLFEKLKNIPVMNSTLLKLLRDAWAIATGMETALLRAQAKEICTHVIKRALPRHHFALQLSLLHSSEVVRSRNMDKRLRVHHLPLEEHVNAY
jgi:hypothetical protein